MTTETTAATCQARTGFYPGEWSEMPMFCDATVGLTTWTDAGGFTHRACRHHREALLRVYPRPYVSENHDDGLGQAKAAAER